MKLNVLLLLSFALPMAIFANGMNNANPKGNTRLYTSHFENVLGTSMEIKVRAGSQKQATAAETAAMHEISRLAKILSAYDAASEFSKWLNTSNTPEKVSPELYEVLDLFEQWRLRSNGALDAAAEVVTKLWKQAALSQHIPDKQSLEKAVAIVKEMHWKLDPIQHTATHIDHAPLMLNSFAKSYIIQHAVSAARASGKIDAVVVNIGGDLMVAGDLNEPVQISNPKADAENDLPLDKLLIDNKAVATSGNYRRGELIKGHWYSHIVDPRTGLPADNIISATVVSPSATDAGALATAFNVMSPAESMALAATFKQVDYMIITSSGDRFESRGWAKLETPTAKKEMAVEEKNPNANAGWGNEFEMLISLEINLQKQGFVKRPYVAVWIEDENHAAVRTVAIWHERDRYLPELKSWFLKYRGAYTSNNAAFSSVSSATRSAGKYTVKWDGKDDNGNLVKPGKYNVKIEAAREHGTYQLMKAEVDCNEKPQLINLAGNIEIAAASIDYKQKAK